MDKKYYFMSAIAGIFSLFLPQFIPDVSAQSVSAFAGNGRDLNVTVSNSSQTQNIITSTTETNYSHHQGFGISATNVTTINSNAPIQPSTGFIPNSTGPFSLSIDSYTPGISKVIKTEQNSTVNTTTTEISVFNN